MKFSRLFSCSLVTLCVFCIFAERSAASFLEKTFGGDKVDVGNFIQQTSDGGYIIVGETSSFGAAVTDVYLIKTDVAGNEVWSKTFGASRYDGGRCVRQTRDGGYIIVGYIEPSGPGTDVYLIKTDANGDEVWSKTFGGTDYDQGYSVQQTTDDGYILVGSTPSAAGDSDVYLIKTDADGNAVWSRTFGGTGTDAGYAAQQTSDGGYIIVGQTESFAGGQLRTYLIKTDAEGNEEWQRAQVYGIGYSIQQTGDGGYIIVGVYPPNNYDAQLIKTDINGYSTWTKTFGGQWHDYAYAVEQTGDGGYILAGFSDSFGPDSTYLDDVYLIKTESNGNGTWSKTFGAPQLIEEGRHIIQNRDGQYVVIGGKSGDVYLFFYKPPSIPGDVNGDSILNLQDAIISIQVASGKTPMVTASETPDIGGDKQIGVEEAIYALQYISETRKDGKILFTAHCGLCHSGNGIGSDDYGDVTGRSAAEITNAIAAQPLMLTQDNLQQLNPVNIQAIADFLVPTD